MSKPILSALAIGIIAAVSAPAAVNTAAAAELPLAHRHAAAASCGPCGCLGVHYVYHSELRSTYGTGFDPRNYDQTEPHYYFGPVRAYPRYFVEGVSGPPPALCNYN